MSAPDNATLGACFGPLTGFDKVAIAVSGGGDSAALLHMLADWRKRIGDAPDLYAFTVDHGDTVCKLCSTVNDRNTHVEY